MKRILTWPVIAALALALMITAAASARAATSSTKTKTLSVSGIGLHFRYSTAFTLGNVVASKKQVGHGVQKEVALVLDKANLIAVIAFANLKLAITSKNVKSIVPQFNATLTTAFGHKVTGKASVLRGIPVITYTPQLTTVPGGKGYDRVIYAFVGKRQYELVCQWTKGSKQSRIQSGCSTMLSTLGH